MTQRAGGKGITLWLIDDGEDHHAVTAATVAGMPDIDLRSFLSGHEALAEYGRLAKRGDGALPDVVLMDFYIGAERGDAVTSSLRRIEAGDHPLTIVGYSSLRSASEQIVNAGGNLILRKHRNHEGVNPSLFQFLAQYRRARR